MVLSMRWVLLAILVFFLVEYGSIENCSTDKAICYRLALNVNHRIHGIHVDVN